MGMRPTTTNNKKKKNPICPVKHVQLDYAQLGPFIWGARFYSHSETEGRKTQKWRKGRTGMFFFFFFKCNNTRKHYQPKIYIMQSLTCSFPWRYFFYLIFCFLFSFVFTCCVCSDSSCFYFVLVRVCGDLDWETRTLPRQVIDHVETMRDRWRGKNLRIASASSTSQEERKCVSNASLAANYTPRN